LSTRAPAIVVTRWFLDDTRMSQPVRDNAISGRTTYEYRDEAIAAWSRAGREATGHFLAGLVPPPGSISGGVGSTNTTA
jgi:hypothetical protein